MTLIFALVLQIVSPIVATSEIDCPSSEIGISKSTFDNMIASLDNRTDQSSEAKAEFQSALKACASRHNWSRNKVEAAGGFLFSKFMTERAKRLAASYGIDYKLLSAYFEKLSWEDRWKTVKGEISAMKRVDALLAANGFKLRRGDSPFKIARAVGSVWTARWYELEGTAAFAEDRPLKMP